MKARTISIVGGGASGLACLRALVKAYEAKGSASLPPITINWIDKGGSFGRGEAYRPLDEFFRMQIEASGEFGDALHFQKWLMARPHLHRYIHGPRQDIPRKVYGDYLDDLRGDTLALIARHNCLFAPERRITLTQHQAQVTELLPRDPDSHVEAPAEGGYRILAQQGASTIVLESDAVFLATGHTPDPLWTPWAGHPSVAYRSDDAEELQKIMRAPEITVVGGGAAAEESLNYLKARGYRGKIKVIAQNLLRSPVIDAARAIDPDAALLKARVENIHENADEERPMSLTLRNSAGQTVTHTTDAILNAACWADGAQREANGGWTHADPFLASLMRAGVLTVPPEIATSDSQHARLMVSAEHQGLWAIGPSFNASSVNLILREAYLAAQQMIETWTDSKLEARRPAPLPNDTAKTPMDLKT